MQFSTLKTTLASWLNRDDLTSYLDDFINITLQKLETRYNWKYMEYRATATKTVTGAPTAADAYITLPNSGKMKAVEFLRCYPSTSDVGTWMKQVDPKTALDMWPNLTYDIGQPQVYFIQRDTSEFCVRPTPDQTYIFDILCYNFSSDLSGDTDTNWWTDYHWRVLLYGAMAEANEYVKNAQEAMYWRDKMEEEVKGIAHMETVETTQGDWPQLTAGAAFVV